jgi:hypothetical protein
VLVYAAFEVAAILPATLVAFRAAPEASTTGMVAGSWLAGAIYDHFGFYGAAFGTGILFNAANLGVLGTLALRPNRLWRKNPSRRAIPR